MRFSERFSVTILVAAGTLTLSACGGETTETFATEDGDTGEYTIDQESGSTSMTIDTPEGEVSMRSGADVEAELPDGFTIMDGAQIVSTTIIDQADGAGALVLFNTNQSPQAVADYYRAQAEAAGIEIQIETSINGGRMVGGEGASGTTFSVTAYPVEAEEGEDTSAQESGTRVQLVVGRR